MSDSKEDDVVAKPKVSDDILAIVCGSVILLVGLVAVAGWGELKLDEKENVWICSNPLASYLALPKKWSTTAIDSFIKIDDEGKWNWSVVQGIGVSLAALATLFGVAIAMREKSRVLPQFLAGFAIVFVLAVGSYFLAAQSVLKSYNLEFALWAILVGLIISNTVGTPKFLRKAVRTELYIKTGLVLLGAEVLLSRLLALGVPGICVSWIVTPIVLISTYAFGQRVLKMESRSLNMVVSADMSVCGVSAAIATAAACRAKKEELSLAIGISLAFTVLMMIVMPPVIGLIGLDPRVAGAWIGGTIDSTGAVAAAGAALGDEALEVASMVKMIQNILIGVIAFGVAVYWVSYVDKTPDQQKPQVSEIWKRFPKFVLGFFGASVIFSLVHGSLEHGPEIVDSMIAGTSKTMREWLFCMAFVCIGLETRFLDFAKYLKGGKPVVLYICGQSLNLLLTLAMAYLMFGVLFPASK